MKRMKISRLCIIMFIMIFVTVSVCACGKSTGVEDDTTVDKTKVNSADSETKAPANTASDDSGRNNGDSITDTEKDSADSTAKDDKTPADGGSDVQPSPTNAVDAGDGADASQGNSEGTKTPDADAPDEDDDPADSDEDDEDETGFVYDEDDENDDFEDDDDDADEELSPNDVLRESAWEDSYLIWLPAFGEGYFEQIVTGSTYDYMELSGVSLETAQSYKASLTDAGFTMDPDEGHADDYLKYSAYNENDWYAEIEYNAGTLKIGSGYFEREEDDTAAVRDAFAEAGLPFPEFGELSSCFAGGESGENYIVLTGVSEKVIQGYIADVTDAGFGIDVDTDEEDGIIWYWAEAANGYCCDIQYFDGAVRISCGQ